MVICHQSPQHLEISSVLLSERLRFVFFFSLLLRTLLIFCFVTLAFLGLGLSVDPCIPAVLQVLSEVWPFHVVAQPEFSPCYQYHSLLSPPDVLY